jgi:DNA-binding MarR family transcriptional regulator
MEPGERAKAAAEHLLTLLPRLQRWAATTVQADHGDHGLSLRQLTVLYVIRDGADSPGALSRRLRISPAVVTGLLDRLEQAGYLRRLADPSDRRRLQLALTESGLAASLEIRQVLSQDIAVQLGRLPPAQVGSLAEALDVLEVVIDGLETDAPRPRAVAVADDEVWDATEPDSVVAAAG